MRALGIFLSLAGSILRSIPDWLIKHKIAIRVDLKQCFDFVKKVLIGAACGKKKRVAFARVTFQRGMIKLLHSAPSFWIHAELPQANIASALLDQLTHEPYSCEFPITHHGLRRNAQNLGYLFHI